jgi:hypothetical protein
MSYELKRTRFSDPDQTSGQHTNGPGCLFVREDDASPWYLVEGIVSAFKVRQLIESMGFTEFVRVHCSQTEVGR